MKNRVKSHKTPETEKEAYLAQKEAVRKPSEAVERNSAILKDNSLRQKG